MKAWVARRRQDGVLLEVPMQIGEAAEPFELLVVEVTDQGARRPTRVARIVPPGQRVAVAQLLAPRLVWFSEWDLVLSGAEELQGESGLVCVAQSWLCRLALPPYATGVLARHTHKDGVELRRGAVFDRYGSNTKGKLCVGSVHDPVLGRNAMRADVACPKDARGSLAAVLLDVELGWMSEGRFALSGFQQHRAYAGKPARMVRQGWLCEYDIQAPEDDRTRREKESLR